MMNWLQWFVCLCVSASSWARNDRLSMFPSLYDYGKYNRRSSLFTNKRTGSRNRRRDFYDDMYYGYNSGLDDSYHSGSSLYPYKAASSYYYDDDYDTSSLGYGQYNSKSYKSRRYPWNTKYYRGSRKSCKEGDDCYFSMSSWKSNGPSSTRRRKYYNSYRGQAKAENKPDDDGYYSKSYLNYWRPSAEYKPDDDGSYSKSYKNYKRPRAEYKPDDDGSYSKSYKNYKRPFAEYKPDDDGSYSKSYKNYKRPFAEYKPNDDGYYSKSYKNYKRPSAEYKPDDDGYYSKSYKNYKRPSAEYKPDDDGYYSKSYKNYKRPSAEYKPDDDGYYSKSYKNYKRPSAEYKPDDDGYFSKSYKNYKRPSAEYKPDDDGYYSKTYNSYKRPFAGYKPDDDGYFSKSYKNYKIPKYNSYKDGYYSKWYTNYGRSRAEYKPDDDGYFSKSFKHYGRPYAEYKSIYSNMYDKKAKPEYYRPTSESNYGQTKAYSTDDDGYKMKASPETYSKKASPEKYALYSSKHDDDYSASKKYLLPYSEKSYDKKAKPESTKYSSKSYDDYSTPENNDLPYSEKSYDKKAKPEKSTYGKKSSYGKKTKPVYKVDDDGNVYIATSVSDKSDPLAERYKKYPDVYGKKAAPEKSMKSSSSYGKNFKPKYISDDDGSISYSTLGPKDGYKDLLKYETKTVTTGRYKTKPEPALSKYGSKPEGYTISDDGEYLPVLPPKKYVKDHKKDIGGKIYKTSMDDKAVVRSGRRGGKVELLPYEQGHYQYLDTIKGYYEGRSSYDPVYDKTNNVIYVPMDDKTYTSYSKKKTKKQKKKVSPKKPTVPALSDDDSDYLPIDKYKNPRSVQERIDALLRPSSMLDRIAPVQRGADPRILLDGGAVDLPVRSRPRKPSLLSTSNDDGGPSQNIDLSKVNIKYVTNQQGASSIYPDMRQSVGHFSEFDNTGMPRLPSIMQYPEIKRF